MWTGRSAEQFEEKTGCAAPAGVDFTRERIVLIRTLHQGRRQVVKTVLDDGHGLHVVLATPRACSGVMFGSKVYTFLLAMRVVTGPVDVQPCDEGFGTPWAGPIP